MSQLVNRSAALVLARPLATQRVGRFGAPVFDQNAVTVGGVNVDTGLHFKFKIEKKIEKSPNTADVTIYNLNEQSRAALQTKPLHVRLDVGYGGEVQRIFQGDLRFAASVKEGTTWETRLQVGDGSRAYQFARVNRSFKSGTTGRQVLAEALAAMGYPYPNELDLPDLDRQYLAGLAMDGPAHQVISDVLGPTADWSVQDGRLQILPKSAVRKDQAILVNQDTGMVGPADYGAPAETGKPPVLSFKMLIYPGLTPGGLVRVETRAVTGLFKLIRVVHEGDTHGPTWYSSCEATPR
jgi:hypothetical protein